METEKAAADKEPAKPEKPDKTEKTKAAPSSLLRKPEQKNKGVATTDYIIEGDTEISVEITKPADR